jgi:hypothetical protein
MDGEDRFDLERGVFVMLFEDLKSQKTINISGVRHSQHSGKMTLSAAV